MRPGDDVSLIVSQSMDVAMEAAVITDGVASLKWRRTGEAVMVLSSERMELVSELANDEAVVKGRMSGRHYLCLLRDLRPWIV